MSFLLFLHLICWVFFQHHGMAAAEVTKKLEIKFQFVIVVVVKDFNTFSFLKLQKLVIYWILKCGTVEKVLSDCFWCHYYCRTAQKYSSYKKKLLCRNILRFHLLIFGFFSFIFFFYLAATSQFPFSTVPKMCAAAHQWDPFMWIPVPAWILRGPSPAQL